MKKRILSAFLAIMMLVSFLVACGSGKEGDSTTTAATTAQGAASGDAAVSETPAETEAPVLTDADHLGFAEENNEGKVFTILADTSRTYDFSSEALSGDLMNDAVYNRDLRAEEYLGVDIQYVWEDGSWSVRTAFNNKIKTAVDAGDKSYDLVSGTLVCTIPVAAEGYFLEGNHLTNLNWDAAWWLADMYDRFAIDNKLYGFIGDISQSLYKDMSVIFFNQRIWSEQKSDVNLYEIVRSGDWTVDKFIELTSDMAQDLDGNGTYDEADLAAFSLERVPLGTWQTCMNLKVVEYDQNGMPVVIGLNDRFITAYDKLGAYHTNTPGIMPFSSIDDRSFKSMKHFADAKSATMCNFIYATEHIREMEDDYGIIPIPKYDKEQENYITQLGTSTGTMFVPNTADGELTSKVMECLCYFGHTDVIPKYYEVALKTKYASNEDMQEMLDLIRETATIDFLYVYGTTLKETPNTYFRFSNSKVQTNLASAYAAKSKIFEKSVEQLYEKYQQLD